MSFMGRRPVSDSYHQGPPGGPLRLHGIVRRLPHAISITVVALRGAGLLTGQCERSKLRALVRLRMSPYCRMSSRANSAAIKGRPSGRPFYLRGMQSRRVSYRGPRRSPRGRQGTMRQALSAGATAWRRRYRAALCRRNEGEDQRGQ
jgi:hypothetical protein